MTDAEEPVGPWAREKLGALQHYLTFFNRVLKNQTWCRQRIYVDAFAGPGISPIRSNNKANLDQLFLELAEPDEEVVEYVQGSPRIALTIPDPFTRYIFIELNPSRVDALGKLRQVYGAERNIEIVCSDANSALLDLIQKGIFAQNTRAVVFLDPFGMHIPWSTVEALAKTKSVEVLINFPMGMAIRRLLTRSGQMMPGWERALDEYFGSPAWQQEVYEDSDSLFGAEKTKRHDAERRLLEWYRLRLKNAFGNVSTPRLIKNTRGGHLYYLIWAGPHPKGLEGANHILKMGEVEAKS